MLHLLKNGELYVTVSEGNWFKLENGDMVSPAYVGWESGEYSIVSAPIVVVEEAAPPAQ